MIKLTAIPLGIVRAALTNAKAYLCVSFGKESHRYAFALVKAYLCVSFGKESIVEVMAHSLLKRER